MQSLLLLLLLRRACSHGNVRRVCGCVLHEAIGRVRALKML